MYKIDIEKNDIGNVSVKMTPTVKMWLKGSKTEINFDYKSEITEEMFIKFIKDNMSKNDINDNDKLQNILEANKFTVTLTCRESTNTLNVGDDLFELGRFNRPFNLSTSTFFGKIFKANIL